MATVEAQECEWKRQEVEMQVEMERLRVEKQEREEQHSEAERNFESVQHAVRNLYRVIVSQKLDGHSRSVPDHAEASEDLSSVLTIITQAETALQWRHQELHEAEGSLRRWRMETESLEQRIRELNEEREEFHNQAKQRALELKQTQSLLNSQKEMVEGLRRQLEETEKRGEELKKETEQMRVQREKEDEERHDLERERQRRVQAELLENAQLCEKESRSRLELHNLQGALERERLDRARIEKEVTETKDALVKAREQLVAVSSKHTLLNRDAAHGRDALEKMASLNESLARDKSELSSRILQLEGEVSEAHIQTQKFRSDVASLQRELKAVSMETVQLRAHRDTELNSLQQLWHGERELQRELQTLREEQEMAATALAEEKAKNQEWCEKHRTVCDELHKVKDELCRIAEQEQELQTETHTHLKKIKQLQETKLILESENEELKQTREQLRGLTATLRQQLDLVRDQASGLELQCSHLNTQVHTLLQAKDALHGEIQCLQAELEREAVLRQQDQQVASVEKSRSDEETEHCRAERQRLQDEVQRIVEQLRIQTEERDEDREMWQREREALNSELGQKDGEVEALKNRVEALEKQSGELSDLADEKNTALEQLQVELSGECRALEVRLQHANEEMERWKMRTVDIQREKEELHQRFLEKEERLELAKQEKDSMACLLRKREVEIEQKEKDTEEFMLKVRLQEGVIETLNTQLNEKVLLEEQVSQLREKERAKRKEDEKRELEREAEEREREMRGRGELRQKEAELEELNDRVEKLLRENKHISWMLEEKEANLERVQNKLTRELKNLELTAREAKDDMERWKRSAADMEEVNQTLVDQVQREKDNLSAVEEERYDLGNTLRDREEDLRKREQDIMELKSTVQLLEGDMENERKQKDALAGQLLMSEEQNLQLMKKEQERMKELKKMEEEYEVEHTTLHRELEQRAVEAAYLRATAEEVLKQKDEILHRLDERDAELETLKARLTEERLTYQQRVKEENEQMEKWKMRAEELDKEIETRIRLEREGEEREEELRGEIRCTLEELKQLRVKAEDLDGENREMHRKTLEQKDHLQGQAALLQEREQDANGLREILQQKEEDEKEKAQQVQEDLRRLKERLTVTEQDLKDTQSILEKEGRLRKEKEKELLDCKQKLQLANAKGDAQERRVQELEERITRLMEDVGMLRGKLEEQSGELERKSQLLQDGEKVRLHLEVSRAEEEKLRSKLEELQREQCSLSDKRRHAEKLETQIQELEKEQCHLSEELRREKQEKDMMSFSLKQTEKELTESQLRGEAVCSQVAALRQEVAALSVSKEHARRVIKEQNVENKKMREGLNAGLQEMATLKELLLESHREGERLRAVFQEKKEELVRSREEEDVRAARQGADLHIQTLEKKNQDLQAELLLRESELRKALEAVARERQGVEREEGTVEAIVEQQEEELARPRTDVEEQRSDLFHVMAATKSKEVERLTSRVKELEEALKEKNQVLEKSERVIELQTKEENYRHKELQEREERLELLRKELREKEREMEDVKKKMQVKERTNEKLKYTDEQNVKKMEFAKEKLNEKETELEKVRETAFKEEKARKFLQEQLEDVKRQTAVLNALVESLEKEKQEKTAQLQGDVDHLRESEKHNNECKKRLYKLLQHSVTTASGRRDAQEHEDTLNNHTETLEMDLENFQLLVGRDVEVHNLQDDGVWELLSECVRAVLREKQDTIRRLREKESEVYALKERTEELSKDRDRVRTALEKTESMLIHYKERLRQLDQDKRTRTDAAALQVGDVEGRCVEEAERLCSMQRAVAQLELQQTELQKRTRHLEQHVQKLKTQRQHLRDTLKQVELERENLRQQLSRSDTLTQKPRGAQGSSGEPADELERLRAHAGELEDEVHRLRLLLAANQEEWAGLIDHSLMKSHRLLSLRQDLRTSLLLVSQRMNPSVLQAEADRLDRSIREGELSQS
ncbi:uncharacterized protein LOC143512138 isoform X2 [Brachyhypopomus gauderio]